MRIFYKKLFLFLFPAILVYVALTLFVIPKLIEKSDGPSTQTKVVMSFTNAKQRNYDLVILGNSGTYRGVNPDFLEIPSYNFSQDSDTCNQTYYKLLWLESQNKQIKYAIISVIYSQFSELSDNRNYIYFSYLDKEYAKDYQNTSSIDMFFQRTNIFEISRLKYLINLFKTKKNINFQRENGQYIMPGKAELNDTYTFSIKRISILENYFEMVLDHCKKKNIEVFLCMMPARPNFLNNFKANEIAEFDQYINRFTNDKVHFLNYSHQDGWGIEDFTDIAHLNEKAANRFTKQLNIDILKILNSSKERNGL